MNNKENQLEILSDEYLWEYFEMPDCKKIFKESFSYAIQPYTCVEEYIRDRDLLRDYVSPHAPNQIMLLIHAAKSIRTDKAILSLTEDK